MPCCVFRRKLAAEIELHRRNGQAPGFGRVAEDVAGQRQQGARIGGVGHDLRGLGGLQFGATGPRAAHPRRHPRR